MRRGTKRAPRDLHALNEDGMLVCNPRDREAAHRAQVEGIATENLDAVTCKKCLAKIRGGQGRPSMTGRKKTGRMAPEAGYELRRRLKRHEEQWGAREIYFFVFLRGTRAYVRVGFLNPTVRWRGEDWANLCRLEWIGDADRWGLSTWDSLEESYVPVQPEGGSAAGTPEACVDASLKSVFGWDPPPASFAGPRAT